MDYRMVKQVHKRIKTSTKVLKKVMIVLCVLFVLMGIIFDRGMLFLALLTAGMYFLYETYAVKVKLLLDLEDDMISAIKRMYPQKVFLS